MCYTAALDASGGAAERAGLRLEGGTGQFMACLKGGGAGPISVQAPNLLGVMGVE